MKNTSNIEAEIIMAIENARIMLPHLANTLKIYFDELKKAGFSDEQAFGLTNGFQRTFFPKNNRGD